MNLILIAVISLGAIALVLAAVLYVAIRVAADLPMLASKPVRWKVSFVRWVDSL